MDLSDILNFSNEEPCSMCEPFLYTENLIYFYSHFFVSIQKIFFKFWDKLLNAWKQSFSSLKWVSNKWTQNQTNLTLNQFLLIFNLDLHFTRFHEIIMTLLKTWFNSYCLLFYRRFLLPNSGRKNHFSHFVSVHFSGYK